MSKKLHGFMKRPQNGAKHVDALNTQRQHTELCAILEWVGGIYYTYIHTYIGRSALGGKSTSWRLPLLSTPGKFKPNHTEAL